MPIKLKLQTISKHSAPFHKMPVRYFNNMFFLSHLLEGIFHGQADRQPHRKISSFFTTSITRIFYSILIVVILSGAQRPHLTFSCKERRWNWWRGKNFGWARNIKIHLETAMYLEFRKYRNIFCSIPFQQWIFKYLNKNCYNIFVLGLGKLL